MNRNMISVVIPMYNEEKGAAKCVATLDSYLKENFECYEIVAVNDGSRDKTEEVILGLKESYPNLTPVTYKENQGKGCAVRTGVGASKGDIVLYTDCDLAYGTDVIGKMAKELEEKKANVVIGSRNLSKEGHKGYTLLRKIMSKVYIKFLAIAAGFKYSDSQCGIKCYEGKVARDIFALCQTNGFAFDLEALMIADAMKCNIGEYGVCIINHAQEASKVHIIKDTLKMLGDIRRIKKHVKALKKNGKLPK